MSAYSRMDESPPVRALLDLIAPVSVISRHMKLTAELERREHFRELIAGIERDARRAALWSVRQRELNIDGSPCWCPEYPEGDDHDVACLSARATFGNR